MLIRICDHFKDNPKRIDKLIAIKGLPEEWMFRDSPEGKELKRPWEPDVDKNIPMDIRGFCDPMYVIIRYSAISADRKPTIEQRKIYGVRIDYNSEPGRQMWDDVERFVEESTPRDERIPVPVLCAKDERSSFETYTPRRTSRGSLELVPSEVPVVDLTKWIAPKPVVVPSISPEPLSPPVAAAPVSAEVQGQPFKCTDCDYTHRSKAGLRMHSMKRHPKEKVGVS